MLFQCRWLQEKTTHVLQFNNLTYIIFWDNSDKLRPWLIYMQSSTLTTGPKVLASKIWPGLVKICYLQVRWACKPFTGTWVFYKLFNWPLWLTLTYNDVSLKWHFSQSWPATGGIVISGYVLLHKILTVFATYKECYSAYWQNIGIGDVLHSCGLVCYRKIIRAYENLVGLV